MAKGERVQIRVEGWIGERWTGWFDGMAIVYEGEEHERPVTLLTGPVVDQAALRGLLAKIWDLNLNVISVTRSKAKGVGANE
jgi:hypothetical protein